MIIGTIITKIAVFVLILSILEVTKCVLAYLSAWAHNTNVEYTKKETWLFALSVAYIFTIIFTGIL